MVRLRLLAVLMVVLGVGLLEVGLASCGGRTGLTVPDDQLSLSDALSPIEEQASLTDAQPPPGMQPPLMDALPPLDVAHPRDVASSCPDPSATLIYVITVQADLWSFYPPTATFTAIGHISCPTAPGASCGGSPPTPFSMAVDRSGIAYIVYCDGELFRVSTASAQCRPTPFAVGQNEFTTFGMGYSHDTVGSGETLFVASDPNLDGGGPPARLGWIDTQSFQLHVIGPFQPQLNAAELTGTGGGDLFGFFALPGMAGSGIGQLDKASARVVGESLLPAVDRGDGWAFAFWGGDFYLFTAPELGVTPPHTVVTRFRPKDGSVVPVAHISEEIVGAGVSTCAPQL